MLEKTKSLQVNSHFPKEFFVDYLFEGETDSVSVNSVEFVHCLSIYGRNKSINTKLTLIYTSSEKIIKLKLEEKEYELPILFYRCSIVSECNIKSMVDADVDINYAEDFNDSKVVCEFFFDSCSELVEQMHHVVSADELLSHRHHSSERRLVCECTIHRGGTSLPH